MEPHSIKLNWRFVVKTAKLIEERIYEAEKQKKLKQKQKENEGAKSSKEPKNVSVEAMPKISPIFAERKKKVQIFLIMLMSANGFAMKIGSNCYYVDEDEVYHHLRNKDITTMEFYERDKSDQNVKINSKINILVRPLALANYRVQFTVYDKNYFKIEEIYYSYGFDASRVMSFNFDTFKNVLQGFKAQFKKIRAINFSSRLNF